MNIVDKLFNRNIDKKILDLSTIGWTAIGGSRTYGRYKHDDFENGYSSISAIANAFLLVQPYAVNANGKVVNNANIINVLNYPNQDMSAIDFREALAVMSLVWDKVYIKVHYKGAKPTERNIYGFTFLEGVRETVNTNNDVISYRDCNGDIYERNELIILKGINPYKLSAGYSPARAVRKWTKIDDYVAEYEAGYFENGAVPAGQMVITAKTLDDFRDIKNQLQEKHRGAGSNNNVTYTYRPVDASGKAQEAQITWIPFNQSNDSLDLKTLFDQANQKIDSVYGVPASIRGYNDNNTYASVKVDQTIFIEQTVRPLTLKIYSKFTHELNRLTGGLGYAISFELETPELADEELVEAQTKQTEVDTMLKLLMQGYELSSVVQALDLDDDYLSLVKIQQPEQPENETVTTDEQIDDAPANKSVSKQVTEPDRNKFEKQLKAIIQPHLQQHIDYVIANTDLTKTAKSVGDNSEDYTKQFTDDMLKALLSIVTIYGYIETENGKKLVFEAGLSIDSILPFYFTTKQKELYHDYLSGVAKYFDEQTAKLVRDTLDNSYALNLSKQQIITELQKLAINDFAQYRIDRLSRTEVQLASGQASVISMQNIAKDTGYSITKEWVTRNPDACEFCLALNGRTVEVNSNFLELGAIIEGVDGGIMVNDFVSRETALAHANCTCLEVYKVKDE
jgi:HK97 family phage portal protein